jgi:hypothetical protein
MRHRAILSLTTTAILTFVVAGPPGWAQAAPVPAPAADLATLAAQRQAPLMDMADDVDKVGAADAQFSLAAIDVETNTVVVYRVGGAPAARTAMAQRYTSVPARNGAKVIYRPALLTQRQSGAVVDAVSSAVGELAKSGIEVTQITPEVGGPVTIGVARLTPEAAALATRFATFGAGTVQVAEQAPPTLTSRQDDAAPYSGGAWIRGAGLTDPRDGCSSGFSLRRPSDGVRFLTTAYHCVLRASDHRFWDGGNDYMGTVPAALERRGRDLIAIQVNSDNKIWVGGYDATTAKKTVTRAASPRVGNIVCTSGAYSGALCNARVTGTAAFLATLDHHNDDIPYTFDVWIAQQLDGLTIVGEGDSGGPVIINTDTTQVVALGSITGAPAGAHQVRCAGRDQDRKCYDRMAFSDVAAQAAEWGLTLTN